MCCTHERREVVGFSVSHPIIQQFAEHSGVIPAMDDRQRVILLEKLIGKRFVGGGIGARCGPSNFHTA
ncbi:hypothetical protein D3C86_1647160 [compost metagenome]